ncbi:MAG: hypothetical protein ACRDHO_06130 [Actinomycetota bacterium]
MRLGEHLVRDVQQPPPLHQEAPPPLQLPGVVPARLVERLGHRRPPVDHHRVQVLVVDVPPPDVVEVAVNPVDPAEAQRRLLGQVRQPGQEHLVDGLLGVRVPGHHDPGTPGRLVAHVLEALVGAVEVGLLLGQVRMGRRFGPGLGVHSRVTARGAAERGEQF